MKRYAVRESIPREAETELAGHAPLARELLWHRGVRTQAAAESFLNPDYELHTHDPFLMPNMEKAVSRILLAIQNNEKVCIYSDYDCDGVPGAVVLHDFFMKIGYPHFENYIPHRHDEGFGLNHEAMEKIAAGGAKLLITVDCGIADVAEVVGMQKRGVDVIITDHHIPGEELPPAFAIVNPKLAQSDASGKNIPAYPFPELCGSGVAFKLVQALLARNRFGLKEGMEKWLLDMVGVATCADMVPLQGENRVFAYWGLKVLRKSPRAGLQKLFARLKTNQKHLTEDDIGFTLGPRINAASRMGVPMDAFRLLSTSNESEAERLAEHLDRINDERKGLVASMVKEIRKKVLDRHPEMNAMPPVIVSGNPSWRPSLLGLAANALMEEHGRPVFLWGREGERASGEEPLLKGSCRSDGGVSVVDLMRAVPEGVFVEMGGHRAAGGFAVTVATVDRLEAALLSAHAEIAKASALAEAALAAGPAGTLAGDEEWIDSRLSLAEVNWRTYSVIERLAPFGVGNPKPLFLFENAQVLAVKHFGKEKNHLELLLAKPDGGKVPAISFFTKAEDFSARPSVAMGNPSGNISAGSRINLVAVLEKSMFRNFPELRLRIVDIL